MAQQKKHVKIWTAVRDSKVGMMVSEKEAYMVANGTNYVGVNENGIILAGNGISFHTLSENKRNAGLFVERNDIVKLIPTTLVTPMSDNNPYPPLAFANEIVEDMPLFLALSATAVV